DVGADAGLRAKGFEERIDQLRFAIGVDVDVSLRQGAGTEHDARRAAERQGPDRAPRRRPGHRNIQSHCRSPEQRELEAGGAACRTLQHSDLSVNPECVCQERARPCRSEWNYSNSKGRWLGGPGSTPGREAAPEGKVSGSARPDEGEPPRPANGAAM